MSDYQARQHPYCISKYNKDVGGFPYCISEHNKDIFRPDKRGYFKTVKEGEKKL